MLSWGSSHDACQVMECILEERLRMQRAGLVMPASSLLAGVPALAGWARRAQMAAHTAESMRHRALGLATA